jgi:hypothetical protein
VIAFDLVRLVKAAAWQDTVVTARDEQGRVYRIAAVENEPQSDDGEGHVTSTGPTVWLTLEEL